MKNELFNLINKVQNGATVIFYSPEETRRISLESIKTSVMQDEWIMRELLTRALTKNNAEGLAHLEVLKELTLQLNEALSDYDNEFTIA